MESGGYKVSVETVDVSSREAVHALVERATSLGDASGLMHAAERVARSREIRPGDVMWFEHGEQHLAEGFRSPRGAAH